MKSPIIFRIHDHALRSRLDKFVKAERKRTGYTISANDVVVRALGQFLDAPKVEVTAGGSSTVTANPDEVFCDGCSLYFRNNNDYQLHKCPGAKR